MGLDLLELQLEVEETFGFSISDEDTATLDTVGKLYDYILSHRFQGGRPGCLTSVVFYRLRRALMSVLGIAKSDVRLSSKLSVMIPSRRRKLWSVLHKTLRLRLPALVRPVWVTAVAWVVGCVLVVLSIGAGWQRLDKMLAVSSWFVIAFVVAYVLQRLTTPFAVVFPSECSTVGLLTKSILQKNYGAISDECGRINADEVWNTLRTIIVEQLGVRPDDVTKDASFVKDLGAG